MKRNICSYYGISDAFFNGIFIYVNCVNVNK